MAVRKRRTAEESRALILQTAAARLRTFGLEGLNITGVAEEAGISHATLIHHFGSSAGMRDALADKMSLDLIEDLVTAMKDNVPVEQLTQNVFSALAEGGHAKLLAWRAVEGQSLPDEDEILRRFSELMETTRQMSVVERPEELRQIILLVAVAAIGYGVAGAVIGHALNMSEEELGRFPGWLTEHLS